MRGIVTALVCIIVLIIVDCLPSNPKQRQKRGFRSAVADRVAHGFGKRTRPLYTDVPTLTDLLSSRDLHEDSLSDRLNGISILDLAKYFHDNSHALIDYLGEYVDTDGNGVIDFKELLGNQERYQEAI